MSEPTRKELCNLIDETIKQAETKQAYLRNQINNLEIIEKSAKELAKLLKSDSAIPAGVLRELAGLLKNSERIL